MAPRRRRASRSTPAATSNVGVPLTEGVALRKDVPALERLGVDAGKRVLARGRRAHRRAAPPPPLVARRWRKLLRGRRRSRRRRRRARPGAGARRAWARLGCEKREECVQRCASGKVNPFFSCLIPSGNSRPQCPQPRPSSPHGDRRPLRGRPFTRAASSAQPQARYQRCQQARAERPLTRAPTADQ
jgi:hypothetical protein